MDPDQVPLQVCAFDDCVGGNARGRARSSEQPLYVIVYNGRLMAVCRRCRERVEGLR